MVAGLEEVRLGDVDGEGARPERTARNETRTVRARPHLAPGGSDLPIAPHIEEDAGVADKAGRAASGEDEAESGTQETVRFAQPARAERGAKGAEAAVPCGADALVSAVVARSIAEERVVLPA